jgi:plastocyanin
MSHGLTRVLGIRVMPLMPLMLVKQRMPSLQLWAVTVLCAICAMSPTRAVAQGTVSGRVTINERPGEPTTDLANTVIYLVPIDSQRPRMRPSAAQNIAMSSRAFVPRVRVMTPGSKVEFPNQDPFSHNIFSTAANARFDLGLYPAGQSRDVTFRRAGVFPVYCNIHPRMTAFVVVVPTPYFVMAGPDGRFGIQNVPIGRYQARFWHDRAPTEVTMDIEVGAAGRVGVDAALDARGFQFVQHKNKFGQEYSPASRIRY